jgi:hypothetical protein
MAMCFLYESGIGVYMGWCIVFFVWILGMGIGMRKGKGHLSDMSEYTKRRWMCVCKYIWIFYREWTMCSSLSKCPPTRCGDRELQTEYTVPVPQSAE